MEAVFELEPGSVRADLSNLAAAVAARLPEPPTAMDADEGAAASSEPAAAPAPDAPGRVGPARVQICKSLSNGDLHFRSHDCDVESHSNFSSIRANACVFAGKWMWELTLGSSGIQQVGWATQKCRFTNEEGVGDSPSSYAFDGKRVKKWNVGHQTYGQPWEAGDVIGCLIDLDASVVSFTRNGVELGPAFEHIGRGSGVAYFPALSLSMGENSCCNFGRWPMRYPQEGFAPLEAPPPEQERSAARYLVGCFRRLLPTVARDEPLPGAAAGSPGALCDGTAVVGCHACLAPLGPLLGEAHVVAGELAPLLLEAVGAGSAAAALDMLLACIEPPHLAQLVGGLMEHCAARCMMTALGDEGAIASLGLARLIAANRSLLNLWLRTPAFPYQLEALFSVKKPSKTDLATLLPAVWWANAEDPKCSKEQFEASVGRLQAAVAAQYAAQQELCDTLLLDTAALGPSLLSDASPNSTGGDDDVSAKRRKLDSKQPEPEPEQDQERPAAAAGGAASEPVFQVYDRAESPTEPAGQGMPAAIRGTERFSVEFVTADFGDPGSGYAGAECDALSPSEVFRDWARQLAFRNAAAVGAVPLPGQSGPSVVANVFFCYLATLQRHGSPSDEDTEAAMNCLVARFLGIGGPPGGAARADRYPSLPRLGGLFSSICKEKPASDAAVFAEGVGAQQGSAAGGYADTLEVVMLMYHVGVKQQLKLAATATATQLQAIAQLEELEKRIAALGEGEEALRHHTMTKQFIWDEITENSRLCVWYKLLLFRQSKLEPMFQACATAARMFSTLSARWVDSGGEGQEEASEPGTVSSTAFSYVPEFYLDTLIDAFSTLALKRLGEETTLPLADDAHRPGLVAVIDFLGGHFNSRAIINSDVRDSVIQCVGGLLQVVEFIAVFEQSAVRFELWRSMLAAFDAHSWLQVASILLRSWRGTGFGDGMSVESAALIKTGSVELQGVFVQCVQEAPQLKSEFLNRVLDNLNWTMTEFGLSLTEVDSAEDGSNGHNQRKCTIMFELSINLLRVLEFFTAKIPETFCDKTPEAEVALNRLVELMVHALNRTTEGSDSQTFSRVVERKIPSLEKVTRQHIFKPIVGIISNLGHGKAGPESSLLLDACTRNASVTLDSFKFLCGFGWEWSAEPSGERAAAGIAALRQFTADLEAARLAASQEDDELGEVPDEFLDPITMELMANPVILPGSKVTMERSVIARHLLSDQTDPFNRSELTLDMVTDDDALKARIGAWKAERQTATPAKDEEPMGDASEKAQ